MFGFRLKCYVDGLILWISGRFFQSNGENNQNWYRGVLIRNVHDIKADKPQTVKLNMLRMNFTFAAVLK